MVTERKPREMRLFLGVGSVLVTVALITTSSCTHSVARFTSSVTSVTAYGQSDVGVGFTVKDVGTGGGTPECTIRVAPDDTSPSTFEVEMAWLGPTQSESEVPYLDYFYVGPPPEAQDVAGDQNNASVSCDVAP
jgi:hypothetical protein